MIHCCFVIALLLTTSATQAQELSRAPYAPEPYRLLDAPADAVWAALERAIADLNGTVLTRDSTSGLLVFAARREVRGDRKNDVVTIPVFYNVLVHASETSEANTVVYARVRGKTGPLPDGSERLLFDRLTYFTSGSEDE